MIRSCRTTCLAFVLVMMILPAGSPGELPDEADSAAGRWRRLPSYYGQIGISDRQRERIYALQAEYNSQIKELTARIDELKARRDAQVEAVLTDAQKERLQERREEAQRAREARRAAREAEVQ